MKVSTIFKVGTACVAMLSTVSTAQGQTCVGMAEYDSLAASTLSMVRSYTAPADSVYNADRISLSYPLVAANQVMLVTKEQDCKKARDAYRAATTQGSGWTSRVVVIKAGSTYTVIDPGYAFNSSAKSLLYAILNQQFKFQRFLGG